MSNWQTLLKQEIPHLFIYLETIMQTGGAKNYRLYVRPIPFKNINGFSGYYYQIDDHEAMVGLGLSRDNQSYVIYRKYFENEKFVERFDYFNAQGTYNYFSPTLISPVMELELLNMDPTCPFINLLYNYLSFEYTEAESGTSRTDRVFNIEKFLQKLYHSDKIRLSVKDRSSDLAIKQIFFQMNESEMDPVLNWEERRLANQYELGKLETILKTKCRVHKLFKTLYDIPLSLKISFSALKRFGMRPWDNIKGISFYWTIGQVFSLMRFMRTNPLASFLLLTYVGIAYYYFTTPQNPYTAHIKSQIKPLLEDPTGVLEDKIQTKLAANLKEGPTLIQRQRNNPEFDVITTKSDQLKQLSEEFEKGIELPSQLGRRIEQTVKLTYPMIVEAAWLETESYQWKIFEKIQKSKDKTLLNYLQNEYDRSLVVQVYLWNELAQFVINNSEFLLDKNNEQLKSNLYQSRSITLLDEMTKNLETKLKKTPSLQDSERIHAMAEAIRHSKLEKKSLLANLKENSSLFNNKGSDEYRLANKKQWEILFVQSSKLDPNVKAGQELSLQSSQNSIWAAERFYAVKNKELDLLTNQFDQMNRFQLKELRSSIENTLYFYKTNALAYGKELPQVSQLEKIFLQSVDESEILESAQINNNQMSGLPPRESKSENRY